MYVVIESFGGEQLGYVFFGPFHHIYFGASIELPRSAGFLCPFSII
jgi:hypothetical protein